MSGPFTSIPNARGDAVECAARVSGAGIPDPLPSEYGNAFGMTSFGIELR